MTKLRRNTTKAWTPAERGPSRSRKRTLTERVDDADNKRREAWAVWKAVGPTKTVPRPAMVEETGPLNDYDVAHYRLYRRFLRAGGRFCTCLPSKCPSRKTDLIGSRGTAGHRPAEPPQQRRRLARRAVVRAGPRCCKRPSASQMGLLWSIAHDAAMPPACRAHWAHSEGFVFKDGHHWRCVLRAGPAARRGHQCAVEEYFHVAIPPTYMYF